MTFDAFEQTVTEVAELNGLSEDLAAELVSRVGDMPETDEQDRIVVTDATGKVHHLIWPTEED